MDNEAVDDGFICGAVELANRLLCAVMKRLERSLGLQSNLTYQFTKSTV